MKRIYKYSALGIIAIVAASVGALLAHVALETKHQDPTLAIGTLLQPPRPLPNFSLLDQDGQPFDAARLRGHWSVLFFGFTNCGDVCPTTLTLLAAMNKSLADLPQAEQPQIVFVSVDTHRDTPETVKDYVKSFDASFIGVTGEQAQLNLLTRALGVPAQVTVNENGGVMVDHSSAILIITPQGEFRAIFSAPHVLRELVADYRALVGASR